MDVKDKICIVTGANSGLGFGIVEKFLTGNAKMVYSCDLNTGNLLELARKKDRIKPYKLDVTNRDSILDLKKEIENNYGKVDVIVNNAGITKDSLLQKMEEKSWDDVINVNLKGVFNVTQIFLPLLFNSDSASVVSISSVVGMDGNIGQTNYSATKAGVIGMTKTWSKEFTRKGANIRVNAVAPGFIRTPMTEKVPEKIIDYVISKTPMKRMGEIEDIANTVLFLCSEKSSFITGQVIRVDGGLVL